MSWRSVWRTPGLWFGLIAIAGALLLMRPVRAPAYTDAYYHYNAALRFATGQGLTDTYLWTYVGAPEALPPDGVFPSHLYWMPLTSVLGGLGVRVFGAADAFASMQWVYAACVAGAAGVGYGLGRRFGGTTRAAWSAGLITLGGGFYARYWGTTDTFAAYALFGGGGLLALALAWEALRLHGRLHAGWWAIAGLCAGLAHLTRPDGLLLVLAGGVLVGWAALSRAGSRRMALAAGGLLLGSYALVMLPWMARNLAEIGTPLPLGGTASAWFASYDDLFRYPPGASAAEFWAAGGLPLLLRTRWEALAGNAGTFIVVEGMVVLTPLMLAGLWARRREAFLAPFCLVALGLHVAMTLVFPFPGLRGGLLHGAVALAPWWAALAVAGCDGLVGWAARRRRWRTRSAQHVFGVALVAYVLLLSAWIAWRGAVAGGGLPPLYAALDAALPPGARVMINDPAALYTYTGRGGAAVPASAPAVIPEVAARYQLAYVVLEAAGLPAAMIPAWESPPEWLQPIPFDLPGVRVYAIVNPPPAS